MVFVLVFVGAGSGFACFAGALFAAAEGSLATSASLVQVCQFLFLFFSCFPYADWEIA